MPLRRWGEPRRDEMFDELNQEIHKDAQEGERKQGSERQRRIELRGRAEQQESQPFARSDKLANHRSDDRERDRDLGTGEHERKRSGELNLHEHLPWARAQAVRKLHELLGGGLQARRGVDDDWEERDQPDDREL